jgi:hypothetical protein
LDSKGDTMQHRTSGLLLCALMGMAWALEIPASEDARILAPPVFDTELLHTNESKPAETATRDRALSMLLVREPLQPADEPAPEQSHSEAPARDPARWRESLAAELGAGFAIERCGPLMVASDVPRSKRRHRLLRTLHACHDALQRDYFRTAPQQPVVVFAFRNRESYRYNLKRLWNEMPISPYGHYNYTRGHVVCNVATGTGTVVHETVHAMMDADMPRAPVWIAEGIATLYEQCGFDGRELHGRLNWRLPELKRRIRAGDATRLADLLQMDDADFNRSDQSLNYATARYLCYYLEQRGLLRQFYRTYRDRFTEDPTGRRFLEEITGKPLETLEAEWRGWVLELPPWNVRSVAAR